MNRKVQAKSLFVKFVLVILLLGLLPTALLSFVLFRQMFQKYRQSLVLNYRQAAQHINDGIENDFAVYNDITNRIYQYDLQENADVGYNRYDSLRQMLNGENADRDLENFLKTLSWSNNDIYAVHFIGYTQEGAEVVSHFSAYSSYFRDEESFRNGIGYDGWDRESNQMILVLPHEEGYFGSQKEVITVGRNYFDIRGELSERAYVGTVFLDIDISCLEQLIHSSKFRNGESVLIVDADDRCIYHNQEKNADWPNEQGGGLTLRTKENVFGMSTVIIVDEGIAFSGFFLLRDMIYGFQVIAVLVLVLGAIYFSRKLTRPVYDMMEQMAQIETGNFDLQLYVDTNDEIGILAQRFNRMSGELKRYIDKSYVAQVKQYEAELNALKSQIYPHFLYNTLEVIRMTALEEESVAAAQMIEALAQQIRYLMGTVKDLVPLEQEIECVRQYIRLLNFRIQEKVTLHVATEGNGQFLVPKLILQPVVENAYIHGLKPGEQNGYIRIEAVKGEGILEVSVLDNGVGIASEDLERLQAVLDGQQIGEKTEHGWQGVGLKNVHDRIRYLYGENYGIHITSTAGIGTMINILLPEIQKDVEKCND